MNKIGFFIFKIIAWFVSLMPMWVWKIMMFLLYILLYYIVAYRRRVTRDNLIKCFTEKPIDEIKKIEKKYYKHLARLVIENLPSKHLSKDFFEKEIPVNHSNLLTDYVAKGRKVFLLSGHFGNWEWAGIRLGLYIDAPFHIVYKPITNPLFEDYFKKLRTHLGNETMAMYMMPKHLLSLKGPCVTCILADQTPSNTENLWLKFLGRDTLFFSAIEKLVRKTDAVVVFGKMLPGEDGRYIIDLELITDDIHSMPENTLMPIYVQLMEANINQNPYNWLWSHRRWKHQKEKIE